MRTTLVVAGAFALTASLTFAASQRWQLSGSSFEPEFEQLDERDEDFSAATWRRPDGPLRVGLQVGHWKNTETPAELERVVSRGGGTRGGGKAEWEVGLALAQEATKLLEAHGVKVDLLPTTVPPAYWADAFVAIHADGNFDPDVSGFKVAAPWRDRTGKADELVALLTEEYARATKLPTDANISHNMRGYYAFNWRRYEHAIHPMTPAAIIETGFLTNPADQQILIQNPGRSASGIANAILRFLNVP